MPARYSLRKTGANCAEQQVPSSAKQRKAARNRRQGKADQRCHDVAPRPFHPWGAHCCRELAHGSGEVAHGSQSTVVAPTDEDAAEPEVAPLRAACGLGTP